MVPSKCIVIGSGDTQFLKLSPINYSIVKLLTQGQVSRNCSVSGSPGIIAIQKARNQASGLIAADEPINPMLIGSCSDTGIRCAKKPRKMKYVKFASSSTSEPVSDLVSFEVPGAVLHLLLVV